MRIDIPIIWKKVKKLYPCIEMSYISKDIELYIETIGGEDGFAWGIYIMDNCIKEYYPTGKSKHKTIKSAKVACELAFKKWLIGGL